MSYLEAGLQPGRTTVVIVMLSSPWKSFIRCVFCCCFLQLSPFPNISHTPLSPQSWCWVLLPVELLTHNQANWNKWAVTSETVWETVVGGGGHLRWASWNMEKLSERVPHPFKDNQSTFCESWSMHMRPHRMFFQVPLSREHIGSV